jgi:para-nitrobenzyl esterase
MDRMTLTRAPTWAGTPGGGAALAALVLGLPALAGCDLEIELPAAESRARAVLVEVTTEAGALRGVELEGLVAFKGVPYATPPGAEGRFAPPPPLEPWSGTRAADEFAPPCPQPARQPDLSIEVVGSEDCLYLNVWAPTGAADRPVMVFIHGGAGFLGSTASAAIGGAELARETGNVVVTMAYRLGPLGYLALPELGGGNHAIQDQQAALGWVQRNIGSFGGDPGSVMLFGESHGSACVCAHLAAPESRGLFHAAAMESGSCFLPDAEDSYPRWEAVADEVGCSGADRLGCLREVPVEELVRATTDENIPPSIDGAVVPAAPLEGALEGANADIPIIVGSNADEAKFFFELLTYQLGPWSPFFFAIVDSEWGYRLVLETVFGDDAAALRAIYPWWWYALWFPEPGRAALNDLITDVSFACPAREWARAWTAGGGRAYHYEFTAGPEGRFSHLGAFHGIELFFVFGSLDEVDVGGQTYQPSAAELELSSWMQSAWSRFAASGAPLADPSQWPAFSEGDPRHYEIGHDRGTRSVFRWGRCDRLIEQGLVPSGAPVEP